MRRTLAEETEPYLAHLRALPFVERLEVVLQAAGPPARPDAILRVKTRQGACEFQLEIKRTNLTYEVAREFVARTKAAPGPPWLLLAPHVGRQMGTYLGDEGANYVDTAGNCRIKIGDDRFVIIEGRPAMRPTSRGRGIGAPGHHVLFAILARPELLNAPVRTLAEAAGVGKTAAANLIARLREEGLIVTGRETRFLPDPKILLDRWLAGYAAVVRPRILVGTYRTHDPTPEALEDRVEKTLGEKVTWAWGGGVAAMRLTGYYRGLETVLHVDKAPPELPKLLRALPAEEGTLTVLRVPGRVAFEGKVPRTVHPLLVYTELLASGDPRAREAAQEIRDRFLQWHH